MECSLSNGGAVTVIVYSIAIDTIVDYPIGMERFFGWDAKIKKVSVLFDYYAVLYMCECSI